MFMRSSRSFWGFILITLSLILSLAGCGKQAAKTGSELTVGYASWGKNNGDVALYEEFPDLLVRYMIYDRLFDLQRGKLIPRLAERYEVADGGKTVILHLRPGVKFHDGTVCDAQAVKFSLERAVALKYGSWIPLVSLLEKGKAKLEVKDRNTVVLRLAEPNFEAVADLAEYHLSIMSPKCVDPPGDPKGQIKTAIGTGAWRVVNYIPGDRLVLAPFKDYWGERVLSLRQVTIRAIPDENTRVAALKSGEVNCVLDNIHGGQYYVPRALLTDLRKQGYNVLTTELPETRCLIFNYQKEPFSDPAVRRALSMAVNKKAITDSVLSGLVRPADHGVWPPGITPGVTQPAPRVWSYNPEEAKRLLAKAGWRPGPDGVLEKGGKKLAVEITVNAAGGLDEKQVAEIIQQQWKAIGVDARIRVLEKGAFGEARKGHNFDTMLFYAGGPECRIFMRTSWQFSTKSGTPPLFADARTDALVAKALSSLSERDRSEAFNALNAYLSEQAAVIPLYYDIVAVVSAKNVSGIRFVGSNPDFRTVEVH